MLDMIFAPIDWLIAHVGLEAALGAAVFLSIVFAIVIVLQTRRAVAVGLWYKTQFEEYIRELEAARSQKNQAEGDAERWAKLNDDLRRRVWELERETTDLRAKILVPVGGQYPLFVGPHVRPPGQE